ncbi:MAG: universal stress protein [Simkaniaceae bacterium]|nr:universal stress protein [Simkaniaceae bacterium]
MGKEKIASIDRGSMRRILGVADLFAVGYGDLGSSIYYALGITAIYALGATPIALLIAGLVFACTALTYAEMSSVVRESGGSALYTRHAFNDFMSFIAGWALLLDFIVTIAISSYSVAPYLSYFFADLKLIPVKIGMTVFLIFALFVLNTIGSKSSTRFSVVLTFLTVTTQLTIIVIGAATLVNFDFFTHLKINVPGSSWSPTWPQFIKGVAMAMVAYTGIESMAQLSGEARNPSRTVPKAILMAMTTLLVMYIGISSVALSAVTPQVLSTQYLEDPIAGIVANLPFASNWLGPWVGLLGAVILLVAANAGLIGASRLSFNMGEYYQLPRFFYRLHKRYQTPYVSLFVFGLFASLIVIWSRGSLTFLADLYNFGAMLAFFSAHLSLISHRIRFPEMKRPFKIPFNVTIAGRSIPITAMIGCIVTLAVWVLVIITKPDGRYLGIIWMAIGLIMFFAYRKKQRIGWSKSIELEKVAIEEFHNFTLKKILVPTRGGAETEVVQTACQIAKMHGAEVTAVNISLVPFTFPMHPNVKLDEGQGSAALQRAEAIGREIGVPISLEMIQSRSISKTILELLKAGDYDLVVLGAHISSIDGQSVKLTGVTEEIFRDAECRVWICRPKKH